MGRRRGMYLTAGLLTIVWLCAACAGGKDAAKTQIIPEGEVPRAESLEDELTDGSLAERAVHEEITEDDGEHVSGEEAADASEEGESVDEEAAALNEEPDIWETDEGHDDRDLGVEADDSELDAFSEDWELDGESDNEEADGEAAVSAAFRDAAVDEEGYVLIGDAKTLLSLMHDDSAWTKTSRYRLTADIDLEGCEGQNPIGSSGKGKNFMGTFDGAGHTVSGIKITSRQGHAGFFGYVNGASISGLTIEGTVTSTAAAPEGDKSRETAVGGLIGAVSGSATVSGCVNRCEVKAQNVKYVGGIAGYIYAVSSKTDLNVAIRDCANEAAVTGYEEAGGIVGYSITGREETEGKKAFPNTPVIISGCRNSGSVTARAYVGGVAGYVKSMHMSEEQTKVTGCINIGTVVSTASGESDRANAGGIAGVLWTGIVADCTNSGAVSANSPRIGGIAGYINSGTVRNCTNKSAIDAAEYKMAGGIVGCINAVSAAPGMYVTVEGCVNEGAVTGYEQIGGIAGYAVTGSEKNPAIPNQTVRISGCTNLGAVTAHAYTGGIAGYVKDEIVAANPLEISGCTNKGAVTATAAEENAKANVGGIVGVLWLSTVADSTNEGPVNGEAVRVGGVVGYTNAGTVKGSRNRGSVTAEACKQVGGVIGFIDGVSQNPNLYVNVERCFNEGEVRGYQQVGGIVGYSVTAKAEDGIFPNIPIRINGCFNSGSVTAHSYVGGVVGYLRDERAGENQMECRGCENEGTVVATAAEEKANANVGGIAGVAWISNVTDCRNSGYVRSSAMRTGGIVGYGYTKEEAAYMIARNLNTGRVESSVSARKGAVIGSAVKDGLTAEFNYYSKGPKDNFGAISVKEEDLTDDDAFPELYRDGVTWLFTIDGPHSRAAHIHTGEAVPIPNNSSQHQLQCICDEYEGNKQQNHTWDASGKRCVVCGYTR